MAAAARRVTIRISGELNRALRRKASLAGTTESEVIRQALVSHLEQLTPPASAFEIANRMGIIGSVKGLPPDLSTNGEHMAGFGERS
jgi:hypothetical protein